MKYSIFLLILFSVQTGKCCYNEYRVLLSGKVIFTDAGNASPRGRYIDDTFSLQQHLNKANSIYKLTGKIEDYSDLGLMYAYNGQYQQAKTIFQSIELKSPGLYATAANLGTTYELLGKADSAYLWIKKSIEINPRSHNDSEWIHLKILEAKIKAKGDEKYLWTHSILNLNFGNAEIPTNINNIDLEKIKDDIYHQLYERMTFVKPKDPVVAQLLFDLGNISAITDDATSGLQIFTTAKEYGYSSDIFEKRYSYLQKIQFKADFKNNTEGWIKKDNIVAFLIIGVCGITIISGLIFGFILLRKKQIKKEQN